MMLWVMMGMYVPFVAPSLTLRRCLCVTSSGPTIGILRCSMTFHFKVGSSKEGNGRFYISFSVPFVAPSLTLRRCLCVTRSGPTIGILRCSMTFHFKVGSSKEGNGRFYISFSHPTGLSTIVPSLTPIQHVKDSMAPCCRCLFLGKPVNLTVPIVL